MSARRLMMASATVMFLWAGAAIAAQKPGDIPASIGDLTTAQLIEVRDQRGDVMLHGTLKTSSNSTKSTERKADLVSPTGQKAKGKVEIEINRKDGVPSKDELSISLSDLPKMTEYELFIDGQHVATLTMPKESHVEFKLDRKTTDGR